MVQVILTGLATGAVYGLVALAYSAVFYVTRVINFAIGQMLMACVMTTAVMTQHGISLALSIAAGLGVSMALGIIIYFLAVRSILHFNRFSFAWLVSTLGVGIVLESLAALLWGTSSLPFPVLLNGKVVDILGGQLTWQQIVSITAVVVIIVLFEIFRKGTLFGKLGMAISSDPDTASSIGGNVTMYAVFVFALGGLLVGIAGILTGPISFGDAYMGDAFGITGFVALMIGGIEKPVGAVLGGLLLGILQSFAVTYINPQASDWFPFVVVVVVLMIAPNGISTRPDSLRKLSARLMVSKTELKS